MEKGTFLSQQIEKNRLSSWPSSLYIIKTTVESAVRCLTISTKYYLHIFGATNQHQLYFYYTILQYGPSSPLAFLPPLFFPPTAGSLAILRVSNMPLPPGQKRIPSIDPKSPWEHPIVCIGDSHLIHIRSLHTLSACSYVCALTTCWETLSLCFSPFNSISETHKAIVLSPALKTSVTFVLSVPCGTCHCSTCSGLPTVLHLWDARSLTQRKRNLLGEVI